MKIQVLKNEDYQDVENLPKKGTERATGYDVIATSEPEIIGETYDNGTYKRIDYIQYKTNLKLAVQQERQYSGFGHTDIDYDILAFPRSSVSKYNLVLANCIGLIDADYRGEVLLRFKYQWQPEDYKIRTDNLLEGTVNFSKLYKKGDKVCQLKVTKVENVEFVLVNELDSTNRGEGGFGSTDVKKGEKAEVAQIQMSKMEALYNSLGGIPTPNKKYSQLVSERDTKQFNQ
jgi:dUTPase